MPTSTQRLHDAIDQLVDGAREAAPGLYEQVSVLLAELRRRDQLSNVRERYARGHALLRRHLPMIEGEAHHARLRDALNNLPAEIGEALDWPACQAMLEQLLAVAAGFCTSRTYPNGEKTFDAAVAEVFVWEAGECAAPEATVPQRTLSKPELRVETLGAQLQAAMRTSGGAYRDVVIDELRLLGGGLSKTMVLFRARTTEHGEESLVARIESDLPMLEQIYRGMEIGNEYHAIRYLWRHGMPVAEPKLFVAADNPSERAFFVSTCLPGAPRADFRLSKEPLPATLVDAVTGMLAKLHALPIDFDDEDLRRTHIAAHRPATRREATMAFLDSCEEEWRHWGEPASPLIETTLRWLRANAPGSERQPCLIHGDGGLNNIMFEGERISGVVDWETVRCGDSIEELSWLLFLLQGAIDRDAFVDAYVRAGGERPSEFDLRYWGIVARLKLLLVRDAARPRYERFAHARSNLAVAGHIWGERTLADLNEEILKAEAAKTH